MILFDEGRIKLDAPVSTYLPEFTGGYKDSVTVRELLEHRSGIDGDISTASLKAVVSAVNRAIRTESTDRELASV